MSFEATAKSFIEKTLTNSGYKIINDCSYNQVSIIDNRGTSGEVIFTFKIENGIFASEIDLLFKRSELNEPQVMCSVQANDKKKIAGHVRDELNMELHIFYKLLKDEFSKIFNSFYY